MISKICLDAYLLKELVELKKFNEFDVLNSVLELDNLIKSLVSEAWGAVCFCITPWKDYRKEDEEFVNGIKHYIKNISKILENKSNLEQLCREKYKNACDRIKNKITYIYKFFKNQYTSIRKCKVIRDDSHCNKCVSDMLSPDKPNMLIPNHVLKEHPWTISCIVAAFCKCMSCFYVILGKHSYQHFERICERIDMRENKIKVVACIID